MKITVIGAGHGVQALCAYLSLQGHDVLLYNRTKRVIDDIQSNHGIAVEGCIQGKAESLRLTSQLKEAAAFSSLILICIPSHEHGDLAGKLAPHLGDGQILLLIPGRTLGAAIFERDLKSFGCTAKVLVAETDTFILTSRKISNGSSQIFYVKNNILAAPSHKGDRKVLEDVLLPLFSMVNVCDSFMQTSLSNIGAIFHPLPALLNIGRIENRQKFLHYKEGITPCICHLLEELDDERMELARAWQTPILSAREWVHTIYKSEGDSLYELIQNTDAYNCVYAPYEISTRYIYEDVQTGIMPMYLLAKKAGTSFRILSLTLQLAESLLNYPFTTSGRVDLDGIDLKQ